MILTARLRRWLSPACAVPRLRALYYVTLALLAGTLLAAHHLATREHREARLLAVATHACQTQTALPVIFVRPALRGPAATKVKPNIHRSPPAAAKEK